MPGLSEEQQSGWNRVDKVERDGKWNERSKKDER